MRFVMRICLAVLFAAASASAQVSTGTPPYSTIGGGPFDSVNLGNLNVHFTVPVLSKAGRNLPFSYGMNYDSSIWTPVTTNGITQWQPSGTWGWTVNAAALTGGVTFSLSATSTQQPPCSTITQTFSNYALRDVLKGTHPFPGSTWQKTTTCPGQPPQFTYGPPLVATASDGSGYTITVALPAAWSVRSSSGALINGSTYTDPNGNEITTSGGKYYDTLSSTTPVLTTAGAGTPSSPLTLTYTPPSGTNVAATVNYTQYTVATNFGFTSSPAIQEYGPNSVALISSIELPDGKSYTISYEPTPGSCAPLSGTYSSNCVTGRIEEISLPTGGSITYTYTGGPHSTGIFSDGSTAAMERTLNPGGTWTYTRTNLTGTPGPGSTWTSTTVDPAGNNTVSDYSEDSTTTTPTYNLYETQRQVYQGSVSSSNLLETLIVCYNGNYASCPTATVGSPISAVNTYTQLPNGKTRLSAVTYNGSFTGSGLVDSDSEYDYGVPVGTAPGNTHLIQQTLTSYASLSNGIIDLTSSVTVNDWSSGSSKTISNTTYTYDNGTQTGGSVTTTTGTPQHVSITGSRGNLTTLAMTANSGTTLYQTFSYYDTGNLNTSTGLSTSSTSPGPTTTYGYGASSCGNSFVTSISAPLGLSRSMTWNCTGGIETGVTDENSKTVSVNYTDPYFWRPASANDQENNQATVAYSGQTAAEATLSFNSGQSVSEVRLTVDGFGRLIFNQRLQAPGGSTYDTFETDYNNVGLSSRSTMPYNASGSPSSENTSAPATTTSYDALGRPTVVATADGGRTAITYTNNDVRVVVDGSQFFKRQFEYDGLGRLTSVCEISSTLPGVGQCGQGVAQTGYLTRYTYDALGHLLTVTQNAQATSGVQSRSYTYDTLGRLTSESNPETGIGGVNGTITYTYDSVSQCGGTNYSSPGNLVERKDNAGITTCYAHDALNRLTTAGNSSASNTTLREYVYDSESSYPSGVSVANGKSRMVEAKTFNTSNLNSVVTDEFFSYSARGELTDVYESTPNSGGYYHSSASYWPTGALDTLSVPGVPQVTYAGLDGEGRPTSVKTSSVNMVTGASYSTSSTSDALGALTAITLGSGNTESFKTDPNVGRETGYTVNVGGATDTGTLTWNNDEVLSQLTISDGIAGTSDSQTCNYGYDDLSRVASVNCGAIWGQNFSYDAFGNITKNVPSGSAGLIFNPTYNSENQISSLPGGSPQYDANGNFLRDNLNTYTWDNFGDLATVNNGSTTVTAVYDALGHQVQNTADGEFVWGPVGQSFLTIENGQTLSQANIPLLGGASAHWGSSGLVFYRFTDHLGSARVDTTPNGAFFSANSYAPFGEQYATSGAGDGAFTGKQQNTIAGLYDFPLRRLSFSQGRWISPDPAGVAAVDPTNPQSWNRYAYVANNPLSYVDPDGTTGPCDGTGSGCDDPDCDVAECSIMYPNGPLNAGPGDPMPGTAYTDGQGGFYVLQGYDPVTGEGMFDYNYSDAPFTFFAEGDLGVIAVPGAYWYSSWAPGYGETSVMMGGGGGAGGSVAPNTGAILNLMAKAWSCHVSAFKKEGLAFATDALGAIPGEGQGLRIAQVGAAGVGFVNALAHQDAPGAAGNIIGAQTILVGYTAQKLGTTALEAVPVLGNFLSAGFAVRDLINEAQDAYGCLESH